MKKKISEFLSLVLVLSLFAFPAPKASKAFTSKKKITLIESETIKIEKLVDGNGFTYAKSSNKKIVSVKKTYDLVTLTARKKGKATITIKTKNKTTYKYTVTVKKKDITWKAFKPNNTLEETTNRYRGNVLFELQNKIGLYATAAKVEFKVFGVSGAVLFDGSQEVLDILPNAKIHVYASAMNLTEKVASAKITNITLLNRENTMDYKYIDKTNSISVEEMVKDDYGIRFRLKNTLNEPINGTADVIFYGDDAATQPIGMNTINLYTIADGTNNVSVAPPSGCKTYKVFKRAYISK